MSGTVGLLPIHANVPPAVQERSPICRRCRTEPVVEAIAYLFNSIARPNDPWLMSAWTGIGLLVPPLPLALIQPSIALLRFPLAWWYS